MANIQNHLSMLLLLIGQILSSAISIQAIKSDKHLKDLFYIRNINVSSTINAILSHNWKGNKECLTELKRIRDGVEKREEWAVKVLDSFGNFPSGIMHGNSYDLRSFPECFHIDRNRDQYLTRYCVAKVFTKSPGKKSLRGQPSVSLGICLPVVCKIDQLQSVVNKVIRSDTDNMFVLIPNKHCQISERASDWSLIDFFAIGLFGVVLFLMISSTVYDILCTNFNRCKYPSLIMFSMYTNGKKLFATTNPTKSPGKMHCIDGVRVLSIIWVVYGHSTQAPSLLPIREKIAYDEFINSYYSSMTYSLIITDTFFTIGGLLVAIKMLKIIKKTGKLDILSLYWQRYLRLTPVLAICALVCMSLLRFFVNGPIWYSEITAKKRNCEKYWWSTLLYVQNYVNPHELCLVTSWYLSVDMQLFIIAPVLVYLIHRFKKITLIASMVSILCCIGFTVFTYMKYDIKVISGFLHFDKAYYFTHFRFPPWLIGFILGYILLEFPEGSIRIPKVMNLCAWTMSLVVMSAIIFLDHPFIAQIQQATSLHFGLYDSLSRVFWSIAVCYVIFACVHGSGGPINSFLSLQMWQPLSKLSYSIYLVHYIVVLSFFYSAKVPVYFGGMEIYQIFISALVLSIIFAIPLALAFESPIDAFNQLSTDRRREETSTAVSAEKPCSDIAVEKSDGKTFECI